MNSIVSRRFTLTAVAGVALAAGLAAASAQAREPEVQWSVTIGTPVPVYPAPVPVYRPPVVVVPAPPVYAVPRYYRQPTYWDRDGDGIPNRYDRFYNPPWDRDGDGIPNRYDRHPNHWDRDGRHDGWYRGDDRYRDGWRDDGRRHRDRDPWSTPTMSDR